MGYDLEIDVADLLQNDTDADQDTLTVTGASNGDHGTVVFNEATGIITFTPEAGYVGEATFHYTVSDGRGGEDTATVTVTVLTLDQQTGPIPGDVDGDGIVGSSDLDTVRANWGMTVTPGDTAAGDLNGDGLVGSADLNIVRANWGVVVPAASVYAAPLAAPQTAAVAETVAQTASTGPLVGPKTAQEHRERLAAPGNDIRGLAELAWAYQLEQLRHKDDSAKDAEKSAVDAIFAEY